MPRTPSDPVARLSKLEAARAEVKPGEVFGAEQMAVIVGLSWRQLRKYIDDDPAFPVLKRGGEGVSWELDGAAVLGHMIASARRVQEGRDQQRERTLFLAGLGGDAAVHSPPAANGGGSGTSAREMREEAQALGAQLDVQARVRVGRVAEGKLIERGEVERFLWGLLTALQTDVLAIEGRVDKAGTLEPALRQSVKELLADALGSMRAAAEGWIEGFDAAGH